jgi:hypothetical protein
MWPYVSSCERPANDTLASAIRNASTTALSQLPPSTTGFAVYDLGQVFESDRVFT